MADEKEVYKHEAHNFSWHIMHWPVCINCGLVVMKNQFSDWAVRMGCNHRLHAGYESKRAITNPFK